MYGLIPFENNYHIFDAFNDLEKNFFRDSMPVNTCRTDIREDEDKFVMETELPGFAKEDIAIDVSGSVLTLKAEHKTQREDKGEDGRYIRRERSYGAYSRTFDISDIDADGITADYKDGILTMNLPKKQKQVPASRRLEIK